MDKEVEPQSRRKLPYRVVLLMSVTATCVLANLFTLATQHGYFQLWKSLPPLPSSAIHILDADGSKIWVATADGNSYTLELYCSSLSQNCNQWSRVDSHPEIDPLQCTSLERGSTCTSLESGFSPGNPLTGEVKECVASSGCFPKGITETRFALMTDGTVKYWHHQNLIGPYLGLALSTLALPYLAAIIVSLIYSKERRNTG